MDYITCKIYKNFFVKLFIGKKYNFKSLKRIKIIL